jgi:pimeloyl-ACP methyl ester carboxylesterase
MLLVHGFTDTWHAWTPLLPALEAHHDVLAPTLPGHHGGDPVARGTPLTVATVVDAVEAMMDTAGMERAHVVGNSLGGWVCLELAARGRALSVVAVCPAGGWDSRSREERAILRFFRANDVLVRASRRQLAMVARRPRLRAFALRKLVSYPQRVSEIDALTMFRGALGCTVVQAATRAHRAGSFFGHLSPIDCRVRILYGTRDRIIRWPAYYTRLSGLLPGAEFVALEGLGHLPMWDDPDLVARRILEVTAPTLRLASGGTPE